MTDPELRRVEPAGNPRVDALIDGLVCPSCRTIYNAAKAGCADQWHHDNRPLLAIGGVFTPGSPVPVRMDSSRLLEILNASSKAQAAQQEVARLIREEAYERGVAEGRRQATEDADRLRAAASGVKRLNRPMVEQLRRAAADTSPNWDVTATVYPPSARNLVALIDALTAVAEQAGENRG